MKTTNSLILIKHKSNHERKFLCTKRFIYSFRSFWPFLKDIYAFHLEVLIHLKLLKSFLRTSSPKLITCAMLPKHWCFLIVNVVKHKMLLKWSNFTIRRYCWSNPQMAGLSGRKCVFANWPPRRQLFAASFAYSWNIYTLRAIESFLIFKIINVFRNFWRLNKWKYKLQEM